MPKNEITDLTVYLLEKGQVYRLLEDTMVHRNAFDRAVPKLKQDTGEAFGLKEAKDSLDLSRKYLIPFLELLDRLGITAREEDRRRWIEK